MSSFLIYFINTVDYRILASTNHDDIATIDTLIEYLAICNIRYISRYIEMQMVYVIVYGPIYNLIIVRRNLRLGM